MSLDQFLESKSVTEYFWIPYTLFLIVVVLVVLGLLYHWKTYSKIRQLNFYLIQIIFLIGVAFLVMLSTTFFVML